MNKSIWTYPITPSEINDRVKNTLSDYLQITFTEVGDTFLKASMPINSFVLQPMGAMHGGAAAVLAETVASAAANYCIDQTVKVCVGIELNINHLKSVHTGQIDAIACPLHLGKMTQVWEIKIYNDCKELTSASRLTLAIKNKKSPSF